MSFIIYWDIYFVIGDVFPLPCIQNKGGKQQQENMLWKSLFFLSQIPDLLFTQRSSITGEVTQFAGEWTRMPILRKKETEAELHFFVV